MNPNADASPAPRSLTQRVYDRTVGLSYSRMIDAIARMTLAALQDGDVLDICIDVGLLTPEEVGADGPDAGDGPDWEEGAR